MASAKSKGRCAALEVFEVVVSKRNMVFALIFHRRHVRVANGDSSDMVAKERISQSHIVAAAGDVDETAGEAFITLRI